LNGAAQVPDFATVKSELQSKEYNKGGNIMKRWPALIAALSVICLIGVAVAQYPRQAAQADAGWITLFDGKSLDNWNQIGTANWKLEDGSAVADNGNGFLVSKNEYRLRSSRRILDRVQNQQRGVHPLHRSKQRYRKDRL
jgi:hypothetical protein